METYYTILEINYHATNQKIKHAYKRLAILRHPDKNLEDSVNACIAFQKLQAAYSTLSDPLSRAEYDDSLGLLNLGPESKSPESPGADFSDAELSSSSSSSPPSTHFRTKTSGQAYQDPSQQPEDSPWSEFTTGYNDWIDPDNDDEDDNGMEWHTAAWLEYAIRESVGKVIEYNERMGLLASLMGADENYPVEWDELRAKLYREMRYQEGLRKNLNELLVTTDG